MKRFMERLQENCTKYKERPCVVCGEDVLTYGGLDEESGKVYAYLKRRGFGKEDMIFIEVPKDAHFISCMIGVWKAGAAFVIVDEGYPKERVEFICRDTNSKMTLDRALFEEIQHSEESLAGYEETDLHDAAYAVYTSGSTGNPKGVLHEFGNVDQSSHNRAEKEYYPPLKKGFVPPLGFVANESLVIPALSAANTFYPISSGMLRNFPELVAFIEENELESLYLPPSYIRIYTEPAASLQLVDTGSEPANGLYYENGMPTIINNYTMSEAGFPVLQIELDRAYDVAPVGRPPLDIELKLLDDDGNVIEGPGQGELCFRNEYVRGYINLPEQTKKAFVDGWYHTSDICRRDEDGIYYVVGRADDMIKINGNRIEPAEIEAAVKQVTGLSAAAAKGFSEAGRSYVALYYLRGDAEELGILDGDDLVFDQDALKKRLPSYMIPTYYVPLEAFPLNANGKLARKDLKAPVVERNMDDYIAPANETETYFCDAMAKVLKFGPVSADEDFFLAGGDSLRAIQLVTACERFSLSAQDIYTYRTPQKLAEHFLTAGEGTSFDPESDDALSHAWPLLDGQRQNIYYQDHVPGSNFLNIPYIVKLSNKVDPQRFAQAVSKALLLHPPLHTKVFRTEDGTYMQQYEESFCKPVEMQEVREEEMDEIIRSLMAPFPMENSPLYRCGVYKTENAAYFGFVIHHLIADGSSLKVILADMMKLYMSENADIPKDHYFALIKQHAVKKQGDGYKEAQAYFRDLVGDMLNDPTVPIGLRPDVETEDKAADLLRLRDEFERKEEWNSNFFLTACALAEAWYNGTDRALVVSVYSSRDDRYKMTAGGFLASVLTVCVDATPGRRAEELLADTAEQMAFGIAHTEYSLPEDMIGDTSNMVRFNYEKDILVDSTKGNPLVAEKLSKRGDNMMTGSVSVNIIDNKEEEKLHLGIRYAKKAYSQESIERFCELFLKAVQFLDEGGTL